MTEALLGAPRAPHRVLLKRPSTQLLQPGHQRPVAHRRHGPRGGHARGQGHRTPVARQVIGVLVLPGQTARGVDAPKTVGVSIVHAPRISRLIRSRRRRHKRRRKFCFFLLFGALLPKLLPPSLQPSDRDGPRIDGAAQAEDEEPGSLRVRECVPSQEQLRHPQGCSRHKFHHRAEKRGEHLRQGDAQVLVDRGREEKQNRRHEEQRRMPELIHRSAEILPLHDMEDDERHRAKRQAEDTGHTCHLDRTGVVLLHHLFLVDVQGAPYKLG
mmetsp:Transcript_7471/g.18951  ORF Transcript_7471/g.18951 Transcript_7471/m.18951 type:complete len:270 (+) Transcript_7471:69-878(+)